MSCFQRLFIFLTCLLKLTYSERQYLTFCPCHGRLGNQLDQFVGVISFAKRLNRSLLMPGPLTYKSESVNYKFSEIFDLDTLNQVLPGSMDLSDAFQNQTFLETTWNKSKGRKILCHSQSMINTRSRYGGNPQFGRLECPIFTSQPSA